MPKWKTKKQLLAVMENRGACYSATQWVGRQKSASALVIGRSCPETEWLAWFLGKVLTNESYDLLLSRLAAAGGASCCISCAADKQPRGSKIRRIIDDCWRAWCRSGSSRKGGA